ncbi:hypothetical protein ASD64_13045 [Mesorhizobium sp. Root157]|uniref:DUF1176 domain-containing protein n=1 Tax=Mesorhizobium sp. Root157 TaxID=1736477 RepID=UPI000701CD2F|nr:DUF1176 domain-containing protein [Mesorhizobium sp. Root157]KQZ78261.1 hypothetical protein ASD64_13045 [Mesorhizobium sp. Root157]
MKNALASLLALTLAGSFCASALAAESPYFDDRSNAADVVQSLYNAINRHEYARAWDYFGDTKPAEDFETFTKGYDGTASVEVETGSVGEEGAAGSIFFSVPVAIRATGTDGSEKIFSGCYTLRQVNAQAQEPPFTPIRIDKGALKPTTEPFDKALPAGCGDGPLPPPQDSALDQAKQVFAATYGEQCDQTRPGGEPIGEPDSYAIRYKADDDSSEREVRLFRFFCSMAAYNEDAVYYVSDAVEGVRQLQFAAPELDIHYENNDSDGKLEAVNVIGFRTDDRLVNSGYDEASHTITSHAKWRGAGDASSSGTWLFRGGSFSLVQFDVDASYDGEINPETVVDYNTAP